MDAKRGDHFAQADFSLPIACPDLDYFRFADHPRTGLVFGHKDVFGTVLPWRCIVSATVEFAAPVSLSFER